MVMVLNYAKTAILLATLTAILVFMGSLVGGRTGMLIAFGLALVMNGVSFWKSDQLVLGMAGAEEVDRGAAPDYYGLVEELAQRAQLPMPRVYIMHSEQPNAFATGRSPTRSAVCASTGLLSGLSREEIAGVMAHELAHIKNRDTLTMTIAATIGGAVSMLAQWMQFGALFGGGNRNSQGGAGWIGSLVAILLAPLAAMLVQMALSRSREYEADRMGGLICGNPLWLASALQRIHAAVSSGVPHEAAERAPATASLYIMNPLTAGGIDNLFSTHPNTENRVAALNELAAELGAAGGRIAPTGFETTAGERQAFPELGRARRWRGPWGSAR
jgi:heat shock protein HtpX